MTNRRYGKATAGGSTNPLKVKCKHCGTEQYVKAGSDPWVCCSCEKDN